MKRGAAGHPVAVGMVRSNQMLIPVFCRFIVFSIVRRRAEFKITSFAPMKSTRLMSSARKLDCVHLRPARDPADKTEQVLCRERFHRGLEHPFKNPRAY